MARLHKPIPGEARRESMEQRRAIVDASAAVESMQRRIGFLATEPEGKGGTTTMKNTTGATLSVFNVVGIGEPVYSPETARDQWAQCPCLFAVTPTAEHVDNWAIVLNGSADGEAIYAAISGGEWPARVKINDASHKYVKAVDGETEYLESAETGIARIVWKAGTEGTVYANVVFGGGGQAIIIPGRQKTSMAYNGTGTFNPYKEDGTLDTSADLTSYPPKYAKSGSFAANAEGLYQFRGGKWTLIGGECWT